jgi:hypothetical protein
MLRFQTGEQVRQLKKFSVCLMAFAHVNYIRIKSPARKVRFL